MSVDSSLLLLRSKTGILSYSVKEGSVTPHSMFSNLRTIPHAPSALPLTFDSSGNLFVSTLSSPGHLIVQSATSGDVMTDIVCSEVLALEFSPLGTFVVSFSRPVKGTATDAGEGNLRVWRVSDGSLQGAYHHKTLKKDLLQWDQHETVCLRIVSNELHVLKGHSPQEGIIGKLYHKGIGQFKVAPLSEGCAACVVVFNPEAGGKPARASIHKLDKYGDPELSEAVNSRTMFSANEAGLYWNSVGSHVIIHAMSDVDTSGTSYYGSSSLYILSVDGKTSSIVSQSKDGPVYGMVYF